MPRRRVSKHQQAIRQAAKRARRNLCALEGFVSRYVAKGTDPLGDELTRTEFQVKLAEQTDFLRAELHEILRYALLEASPPT